MGNTLQPYLVIDPLSVSSNQKIWGCQWSQRQEDSGGGLSRVHGGSPARNVKFPITPCFPKDTHALRIAIEIRKKMLWRKHFFRSGEIH
jgi:hypothetical protein